MRLLASSDVADLLSLEALLPVVEEAFVRQGRGEVERPPRPHHPIGRGLDGDEPLATGLTMPAYVHGSPYAVTKLATVLHDPPPGEPTVRAQVLVADARTGEPVALLAGERVTDARTGCIGGLAARELAARPVDLGVIGAGTQARWQTRAIDAAVGVERARVFSPSDSRAACAADLRDRGIDARAVDAARAAVEGATVVVTATTAEEPVFPADALASNALVVAVGAYSAETRELPPAVLDRASRIVADVPEEVAEIGDLRDSGLAAADLVALSDVLDRRAPGRTADDGVIVAESVGSVVLDAAAASHLHERARDRDAGTTFDLSA
jgi:alanine dehydrogenase